MPALQLFKSEECVPRQVKSIHQSGAPNPHLKPTRTKLLCLVRGLKCAITDLTYYNFEMPDYVVHSLNSRCRVNRSQTAGNLFQLGTRRL
jgi:hypothetical protein